MQARNASACRHHRRIIARPRLPARTSVRAIAERYRVLRALTCRIFGATIAPLRRAHVFDPGGITMRFTRRGGAVAPPLPLRCCSPAAGATTTTRPSRTSSPSFVGTVTKIDLRRRQRRPAHRAASARPALRAPRRRSRFRRRRPPPNCAGSPSTTTTARSSTSRPTAATARSTGRTSTRMAIIDARRRQDRRHRVPRLCRRRHRQAERDDDGADSRVVRRSEGVHRDRARRPARAACTAPSAPPASGD